MCIACEVRTMKEQIQALQAEVYRSNKRFEKSMLENSNLRSAIGYRNDDIHHLENLLREKDDQIQHLHETGISRQRQVQELLMQEQQRAVQVQQLQTELFNTKRQKAELERRVNCVVCLVVPRSAVFLPCFHVVACRDCSPRVDNCPVCRAQKNNHVDTNEI